MSLANPFRHALPVSESLFHEALYLTHAGWEHIAPGGRYPQRDTPFFYFEWREGRTLPEFCLALVIAGGGEFQTREHAGKLTASDTFLFRPGEWHRHRPSGKTGWTLMWIHFNGDEPLRWLREDAFALRDNIPVIENKKLFRAQFEHLLVGVHRNPTGNSANFSRQAIGLMAHFLTDKSGNASPGGKELPDPAVKAAVEFIWNFSHDIVDVSTVARKVGLARRTLDRRFKAMTGRSVLEEIQFCRVTRAAKLLEETDMPVKHIVQRAGFRSDEHLRLAFKRTFQKPPTVFRRSS
jgi:AraC-like DNA-binding protein